MSKKLSRAASKESIEQRLSRAGSKEALSQEGSKGILESLSKNGSKTVFVNDEEEEEVKLSPRPSKTPPKMDDRVGSK